MSQSNDDIEPEYDFSHGIRGKYANLYHQKANIIVLEPDVAEHFPNSESVNQALRIVWAIKNNAHAST